MFQSRNNKILLCFYNYVQDVNFHTMRKYLLPLLFIAIPFFLSAQKNLVLSHYIFPEFVNGVILMKDGTKINVPLNYNSASEQVVFIKNGQKLALADETIPTIDTVYMSDKKFILESGSFMEVKSGSNYDLFIGYKCDVTPPAIERGYGIKSSMGTVNTYSKMYGSGGIVYELELPKDFKIKPFVVFKLRVNDKIHNFRTEKQLLRIFNNQKEKVQNYRRETKLDMNNIESIEDFIRHMQSE